MKLSRSALLSGAVNVRLMQVGSRVQGWEGLGSRAGLGPALTTAAHTHTHVSAAAGQRVCVADHLWLPVPPTDIHMYTSHTSQPDVTAVANTHLQLVASVCALLVTSASLVHAVERLPWHDALYFVTTTLTTVGYGDVVVRSMAGEGVAGWGPGAGATSTDSQQL